MESKIYIWKIWQWATSVKLTLFENSLKALRIIKTNNWGHKRRLWVYMNGARSLYPNGPYNDHCVSMCNVFSFNSDLHRLLCLYPFLSFHFSFSIPFFGKSGFSILFALLWGDSVVFCFGGKDEDSFNRPRIKKKSKVVSMGSFIVGTRSWYLGQNKFGCQGFVLGPNSHITP